MPVACLLKSGIVVVTLVHSFVPYKKQYTLFYIRFAVVFGLLVLVPNLKHKKAIPMAMGYCFLNLLSSKTEADVEVVDEKASPKTPTST